MRRYQENGQRGTKAARKMKLKKRLMFLEEDSLGGNEREGELRAKN